jgi:bacteriocin-like protein
MNNTKLSKNELRKINGGDSGSPEGARLYGTLVALGFHWILGGPVGLAIGVYNLVKD